MRTRREQLAGWVGSLLIHALLLLLFFFIGVPDIVPKDEFVEVSWGAVMSPTPVPSQPAPASSTPILSATPTTPSVDTRVASQPVLLPERQLPDMADDILRVPQAEKLEAPESGRQAQRSDATALGEREQRIGREAGERDRMTPATLPGLGLEGTTPGGSVAPGADIPRDVSFSVQWLDGGTRRRISGDLPKYPEGVNVEAQIKILAVVMPDGSVKALQPAQKGNTRLEEAAMREVRLWKFEPLRPTQPQVEQNCVITFLFTLK